MKEEDQKLKEMVVSGARERWGYVNEDVDRRLKKELAIVSKTDLAKYLLMVKELVDRVRAGGGYVAAGRDSSCSWALCYAMGFNEVDPLKYHICEDRFLYEGVTVRRYTPCICVEVDRVGESIGLEYLTENWKVEPEVRKHITHPQVYTLGNWSIGLTATNTAECLARTSEKAGIDPGSIPLSDPGVMATLRQAKTAGIEYLDNETMRYALLACRSLDFTKLTHLYSMAMNGYSQSLDKYLRLERGEEVAGEEHPLLGTILEETKGVMVFDDQIVQAMEALAEFSPADSRRALRLLLRRMQEQCGWYKRKFVSGCMRNSKFRAGLFKDEVVANYYAVKMWDQWYDNVSWAGMKAHSVAFSIQALQLAYLKAHYPREWALCNLNNEAPVYGEK